MAIVPDQSPTSTPETDFGANDWLLEEMYEQYTADPDSVDATWVEYFKTHGAPTSGDGDGAAAEQEEPQGKRAAEPDAPRRDRARRELAAEFLPIPQVLKIGPTSHCKSRSRPPCVER